jgi:hypothetical protein
MVYGLPEEALRGKNHRVRRKEPDAAGAPCKEISRLNEEVFSLEGACRSERRRVRPGGLFSRVREKRSAR